MTNDNRDTEYLHSRPVSVSVSVPDPDPENKILSPRSRTVGHDGRTLRGLMDGTTPHRHDSIASIN
ncbi:MAG: hypothetical protein EOP05_15145 [Proteobacteria bacterium]|nr:MAG: hypothetical protein EOP05_15145 [Pseudomonadota bacterium]